MSIYSCSNKKTLIVAAKRKLDFAKVLSVMVKQRKTIQTTWNLLPQHETGLSPPPSPQ